MRPDRRAWLGAGLGAGLSAGLGIGGAVWTTPVAAAAGASTGPVAGTDPGDLVAPGRALAFPRDHGAHPGARIEWWYATGWWQAAGGGLFGFQVTFFRSRTGVADTLPGRFAPRQLLFAHAAVTDVAGGKHRHAQRISRWSGDEALPEAHALRADTAITLGRWTLRRDAGLGGAGSRYTALLAAPEAGFTLDLVLQASQPLLLQGDGGFSRKGPQPQQASHYYSQPQLQVQGAVTLDGKRQAIPGNPGGRGWLDHEWSDELLAPGATGWDWIGINLADGGALTAFVLRRADGSVLWAGGSHRPAADGGPAARAAAAVRNFAPAEVVFTALRQWVSPDTGARYPVHWRITTPVGSFELRALLDAQELDSRASTGTVYWEGLAELLALGGARLGLGYLEMTGRAQPLKLGL